ncbi:carbohydrate-binding module family 48 protein [Didymella exigua CBS 183.55]|uniref:Carbohydrate-binding module family 48 protein n=1 Tax=Didymella exigua CBS 183.55 TaxID=1150837 RepID=A0A6A5RUR5_9PLEO|nr:carbohydrate-binding module family 48 protein [Didymella exigua CBS 183.55]KAF1931233.1 carbohydrate-binding module family 48 protein [Didymella exigua CBS 183.55]
MGKYTFTWEHDADDVYVTGTFDDWKKTVQLEKEGSVFKKTVELPQTKTQFKYVVNGNWCINESAPKEDDGNGIVNNILLPADIVEEPAHTLSSAAPQSSTAALAGAVPKEKDLEKSKSNDSIPGAFPMTPTPSTEQRQFINPIPATAGLGNPIKLAPEEHVPAASTLTGNTVNSTVNLKGEPEEDENATVSAAPIPATAGAGNPIHLAPGEKVPHPSTLTSNTISSTAKTDEASYHKSDSQAPQLPPVAITPQAERSGGMFNLPVQTGSLVPESSLPMGVDAKIEKDTGVHIQSAAPLSSTAALAGQVPKEPRGVPEVVTESQKEAGFAPEAAANSEAVLDKKEVEQELKETVPVKTDAENDHAPTIEADKSISIGESVGAAAGGVAAAATVGAGLFAGAIYAAKEKTAEAVGLDKDATIGQTASAVGATAVDSVGLDSSKTATDNVYLAKDKTFDAVGLDKNATATDNAYLAKDKTLDAAGLDKNATATENAILAKDKTAQATGLDKAADNAYAAKDKAVAAVGLDNSASATENAQLAKDKTFGAAGLNGSTIGSSAAGDVPVVVAESQKEAHASPEAAANPEAVSEKSKLEQELLSSVPKSQDHGEPAPSVAIPALVSDSQREAHVSPEAAANPLAVHDKKEFESELLKSVSKTDESGEHAPVIAAAAAVTGAAALVGGAAYAATSGHKTELPDRSVPSVVAESQKEAHAAPEAAANAEAVAEKKELESELLSQVKKTNECGEPAPTLSAATATTAPGASTSAPKLSENSYPLSTDYKPATQEEINRALSSTTDTPSTTATGGLNAPASQPAQTEATKAATMPATVVTAVASTTSTEPTTSSKAVEPAVSSTTDTTSASKNEGLNAPAASAAQTDATKAAAELAKDDKEGIFKTTTLEQKQPTVTTGTETGTTGTTSQGLTAPETPQKDRKDSDVSPKGTPGSQSLASNSATTDKKSKRRSFFGKLKDKFSSKN